MSSVKLEAAAITSLMTTELNALASGSGAIASAGYDNATNLYLFGLFELTVDFVSAPTADTAVGLYLIAAPDGTNYVDNTTGASEFAPLDSFAGNFQMQATTAAQRIAVGVSKLIQLPPVSFKAFVINNSGQAFPATGSILKMVPYRYQVV